MLGGVALGLAVGVGVGVALGVDVGVAVGTAVGVGVGVRVAVGVAVGVGLWWPFPGVSGCRSNVATVRDWACTGTAGIHTDNNTSGVTRKTRSKRNITSPSFFEMSYSKIDAKGFEPY